MARRTQCPAGAVHAPLLLYEASIERVKPRAIPQPDRKRPFARKAHFDPSRLDLYIRSVPVELNENISS
jgi:hypothetical protein